MMMMQTTAMMTIFKTKQIAIAMYTAYGFQLLLAALLVAPRPGWGLIAPRALFPVHPFLLYVTQMLRTFVQ